MKVRKLFWIIFILFSFLCLTFVSCGKQNKKVSIGFCEFPEQYKEVIVELLSKNAEFSFICNDIDFLNLQSNPEKVCKKYDLIFTKNGEVSSLIEKYANSISQTVLSLEPESLQKNAKNSLPLFIDHYGISYSQIVKQEAGISYPASYNQFKIYLENVKEFSSVPLFIEGSNDDVLLAFIGALVESFSGSEGYFNFLEGLKSCSSVEELLLTKISNEYTVDSIFKEIVELQQKNFLNKGWIKNKKTDFENFSNDNRIAAAFLSLSGNWLTRSSQKSFFWQW